METKGIWSADLYKHLLSIVPRLLKIYDSLAKWLDMHTHSTLVQNYHLNLFKLASLLFAHLEARSTGSASLKQVA